MQRTLKVFGTVVGLFIAIYENVPSLSKHLSCCIPETRNFCIKSLATVLLFPDVKYINMSSFRMMQQEQHDDAILKIRTKININKFMLLSPIYVKHWIAYKLQEHWNVDSWIEITKYLLFFVMVVLIYLWQRNTNIQFYYI